MKKLSEKVVYAFLGMALLVPSVQAAEQDYPSKPIELVVPFAPGGGTDQVARTFSRFAEGHLGTDIFVSNRSGGSGALGFLYSSQADPNGYVITMNTTTLAVAPHTIDSYPVDHKAFEPICLISAPPAILAVNSDSGFDSLDSMISYAKQHPGEVTFATAGPGSNTHLIGASFADAAGIKVRFVPQKGSGPALTAAYGNHVDVAIADKAEVMPWHQDGRLRVLTVFAEDSEVGIPDVPLASDKGFNIDIGSFRGLGAPAGVPSDVLQSLIEGCRNTLEDETFIEAMNKTGVNIRPIYGKEFGDWLEKQSETFRIAAKVLNDEE